MCVCPATNNLPDDSPSHEHALVLTASPVLCCTGIVKELLSRILYVAIPGGEQLKRGIIASAGTRLDENDLRWDIS